MSIPSIAQRTIPKGLQYTLLWSLPFFSGLLLSLSAPVFDSGFFAFVGFIPLLFFLNSEKISLRLALLGSIITGTIYGLAILLPLQSLSAWWWVNPESILWIYRKELLFGTLVLTALVSSGLLFALVAYLWRTLHRNTLADVVVFAMLWAWLEYVREFFVAGFTWGHLGYALHDFVYLAQTASVLGIYGLGGFIVAINILLYFSLQEGLLLWNNSLRLKRVQLKRYRHTFVLIGLILLFTLYGAVVVHVVPRGEQHEVPVAVIHSTLKTEESIDLQGYRTHLLLLEEALGKNPDMVLLPENIFPLFVLNRQTLLPEHYENQNFSVRFLFDELRALSQTYPETSIIYGIHSLEGRNRFNSLAVMENGVNTGLYDKRTLLPFSEKSPQFLAQNHVAPISTGASENTALIAGGHRISGLICSEIIYPRAARGKNSDLIVNISNDSVFTSPVVARQNHIIATFRAIENKQYVLRSTKGGISSIIDPFGRVVMSADTTEESQVLRYTISF